MSDFSVRSDNVDVEQIMRQIRSRIREKRGVDYTEEEIRELARVKLEKFIDPRGVRSGLLDEYRRVSTPEAAAPNYAFGEETLYETHRGPIRWMRSLLRPFLKLLFNPNPLIQALHIQAELNQRNAERWAKREQLDALQYELIHNLVVEVTRNTLEVKSLKMRLESMASRLDFDERRARALEGVVQYRPGTVPPLQPPTGQDRGPRGGGGGSRHEQGRDRDQRPQGPRPPQQQPRAPQPEAAQTGPVADQPAANALDADGNERRARRRRRRGRRRPAFAGGESGASSGEAGSAFAGGESGASSGEAGSAFAGGESGASSGEAGSAFAGGESGASSGEAGSAFAGGDSGASSGETTTDNRYPVSDASGSAGDESDDPGDTRTNAAPADTAAPKTESIEHRPSDIGYRSSSERVESSDATERPGQSGSEPPSE